MFIRTSRTTKDKYFCTLHAVISKKSDGVPDFAYLNDNSVNNNNNRFKFDYFIVIMSVTGYHTCPAKRSVDVEINRTLDSEPNGLKYVR